MLYNFLLDYHQVHADLTLTVAGAYEPDLRHLALRWTDRMTDIFARRIGWQRATALTIFFDGVIMHLALNEEFPINLQLITDTTLAVVRMDTSETPRR